MCVHITQVEFNADGLFKTDKLKSIQIFEICTYICLINSPQLGLRIYNELINQNFFYIALKRINSTYYGSIIFTMCCISVKSVFDTVTVLKGMIFYVLFTFNRSQSHSELLQRNIFIIRDLCHVKSSIGFGWLVRSRQ